MHTRHFLLIIIKCYSYRYYCLKMFIVVNIFKIVAELLSATTSTKTTMEHMDTAELLTTTTETHDPADILESPLLPSTTKTPDQATPRKKKTKDQISASEHLYKNQSKRY